MLFLFSAKFYSKSKFRKKYFRSTISVSNSLDPDQAPQYSPVYCQAWSWSKLLVKVISRQHYRCTIYRWVLLFLKIDAECVKWASQAGTSVHVNVVSVFNIPPTAKVIWRRGHSLKSHPTDWWSQESNLCACQSFYSTVYVNKCLKPFFFRTTYQYCKYSHASKPLVYL